MSKTWRTLMILGNSELSCDVETFTNDCNEMEAGRMQLATTEAVFKV
jgi:hypothetical protein